MALEANKVIAVGLGCTVPVDWRRLPDKKLAEIYPFEIYRDGSVQTKPWSLLLVELHKWGTVPLTARQLEYLDD